MDLKQLQAMGAIVPRTLFKKDIPVRHPVLKPREEWEGDEPEPTGAFAESVLTTFIRKRSSADFLEMIQAPNLDKPAIAILRCVLQEDGREVFESVEQVKQLQEWMFIPLMLAVNEVNEFGLKNSRPRTSYGMNSPSSSAARSPKRKRASQKKNGRAGSPIAPSAAP